MKTMLLVVALGGVAAADSGPDFVSANAPRPVVTLPASDGTRQIEPADIVMFATDSTLLTDAAADQIERAAAWLVAHPDYNLAIEGHTDEVGPAGYNSELAYNRAAAVRDHLVTHGVSTDRLVLVGYGEQAASHPINKNDRRAVFYATTLGAADVAARSVDRGALRATWFSQGSAVDMLPRQ